MTSGEQLSEMEDTRAESGPVALQISNLIGHIHKRLVGRGPTRVRTHVNEELIVCVLEGGFTQAEHTLVEHSGKMGVVEMRLRLQDAMREEIRQAVEAITGRPIRSFMSCNDPGENVQAEVMLLGPGPATPDPL